MDTFVLGDTDFAVDRSESSVQVSPDGLVTVSLWGTIEALDGQGDGGPFGWALHPPHLYLTAVPAAWTDDVATMSIDEAMADLYDIGLYLHEHGDVTGELTLDPARALCFSGSVRVLGRVESVEVRLGLPLPSE
ncbi:hypothetical protein GCM10010433_54600 [Streptomyces pulveraceus]|uniref:Uncharacterized protein n=1 Tax=Streptomyces pulveraceus TaxID=68258 RepID=A0ABW1GSL6_9ACTN